MTNSDAELRTIAEPLRDMCADHGFSTVIEALGLIANDLSARPWLQSNVSAKWSETAIRLQHAATEHRRPLYGR